ncbi:hypothetical protein GCM10027048_10210 [Hymenobacter coalescens]
MTHWLRTSARCGLLLLALSQAPSLAAQSLDPTFQLNDLWAPAPVSRVVALPSGHRLVLGSFRLVNQQLLAGLARFDAGGNVDQAFAQNLSGYSWSPQNLLVLRNGQLLVQVSGSFVGQGLTRRGLVRLNADGSVDPTFDAGTGPNSSFGRQALAEQPDGKILVGGRFTSFSGRTVSQLVRLLPTGALDNSFTGPTFSGNAEILDLAVQPDGRLLAAGRFNAVNGTSAALALVRLQADGAVDASFVPTGLNGNWVYSLALQPDGRVWVGSLGTLRRLLSDGSSDLASSTITGTATRLLFTAGGQLLAAGQFGVTGGTAAVRVLASGQLDVGFSAPAFLGGSGADVAVQPDGRVLVGLSQPVYPNPADLRQPRQLVMLDANGAYNAAFDPELLSPGQVQATLLQPDGQVLVGGQFTRCSGQPVGNLLRLTTGGSLDTAFARRAAVSFVVEAATWQSGTNAAVVGGRNLVTRAGTAAPLRRLLATGAPDPAFVPSAPAPAYISRLQALPGGQLLVSGSANGTQVWRLLPGGATDASFQPSLPNNEALFDAYPLPNGQLYAITGDFSGLTRVRRLGTSGMPDVSFAPVTVGTPDDYLDAFAADRQGRPLLAVYSFNPTTGALDYSLRRYPTSGGSPDPGFAGAAGLLTGSDWVRSIVEQPNGRLLLAGSFRNSASSFWPLHRLLPSGQPDNSFNSSALSGSAMDVLVQPDGKLLLGGGDLGGPAAQPPGAGVVRVEVGGVLSQRAPAAVALAVWPQPATDALHVRLPAGAGPRAAELLDAAGRLVRTLPLAPAETSFRLETAGLAPGVYLLRVSCRAGLATRRVVVR